MANEMELMAKNALSVVTIVFFFVLAAIPTINSDSVGENGSQENNTSFVNIRHLWKQINEGGFGDPKNVYFWSMEIFDDILYVGTFHPNPINILLVKNCFLNWNISFEIPMGQVQL